MTEIDFKRPRNKGHSEKCKNAAAPRTNKAQDSNSKIKSLALVFIFYFLYFGGAVF
jgi:hypothetical protein